MLLILQLSENVKERTVFQIILNGQHHCGRKKTKKTFKENCTISLMSINAQNYDKNCKEIGPGMEILRGQAEPIQGL